MENSENLPNEKRKENEHLNTLENENYNGSVNTNENSTEKENFTENEENEENENATENSTDIEIESQSENVNSNQTQNENLNGSENQNESAPPIKKTSFKFKKNENGLILTIHHTIKENGNLIRIRLITGYFNEVYRQFLTADNRGNIFIFDLANKKFWIFPEKIPKASMIRNIPNQEKLYLIGTKQGHIFCIDVENSKIIHSERYTINQISNITFPGIALKPFFAVVHSHHTALLLNMKGFEATHHLEFNDAKISLKFVSYVPQSDRIFTCFTNDTVHIWSGITLNTIRIHNPIKTRDRFLLTKEPLKVRLSCENSELDDSHFEIKCQEIKELSRGLINSYAFSPDGLVICFTTLDNFILLFSSVSFELQKIVKLVDSSLNGAWLFPKNNENILICETTTSQLVMIDLDNPGIKLVIEPKDVFGVTLSKDREFLSVIKTTGEGNIYCVSKLFDLIKSTQTCVQMVRNAMNQPKALSVSCFDSELMKILTRNRMIPILSEFGQYPNKYRLLIWASILDIPGNKSRFSELVKMQIHPNAAALNATLKLKDSTARRNLLKIFSCLGHWSKIFSYSDFIPTFIFPFVKIFSNSLTVCFEIITTILTNQCQLWFEFHPLEPLNYLGMCENILNHFDPALAKIYSKSNITAKEYAWIILSNGFSEVLDEEEWLCLWDNILSSPSYFMIFCAVAYNMIQRETILRLREKEDVVEFFREQNPIDFKKFIKKSYSLMEKCPDEIHPRRYMKEFTKLPKGVYPKFQNYPKKWLQAHESEMEAMRKEKQAIDTRMRELEREEALMMEKLERGLQQEEYAKRMKDLQNQYEEALRNEEERISYQRKMLALYQKELRQQKGKVMELVEQSARRRNQNIQENELNYLLLGIERERQRNETDLTLAEEQIKDQELELLLQKYATNDDIDLNPMQNKYKNRIRRINEEKKMLNSDLENILKGDTKRKHRVGYKDSSDHVLNEMENTIRALEQEFQSALK